MSALMQQVWFAISDDLTPSHKSIVVPTSIRRKGAATRAQPSRPEYIAYEFHKGARAVRRNARFQRKYLKLILTHEKGVKDEDLTLLRSCTELITRELWTTLSSIDFHSCGNSQLISMQNAMPTLSTQTSDRSRINSIRSLSEYQST